MSMKSLYICMGSACHQKGVYDVLETLKKLISEKNLDVEIELKGAFCLGPCENAIVIKYKNILFEKISPKNIESKFNEEILPKILEN